MTKVPILMLHKVDRAPAGTRVPGQYIDPTRFAQLVSFLRRRGYQTVRLDRLFLDPLPQRPVIVSFDDGYVNFYSNALPALSDNGFGATVFVVTNQIGGNNQWDIDKGDVPEPLLDQAMILDAKARGIEFGSHTMDHCDLSVVTPEEALRQVVESRKVLSELLGHDVTTFCYPYGRKTPDVESMLAKVGYRYACSDRGGMNTTGTNRMSLLRTNIRSDTTVPVLIYKLWRDRRKAR